MVTHVAVVSEGVRLCGTSSRGLRCTYLCAVSLREQRGLVHNTPSIYVLLTGPFLSDAWVGCRRARAPFSNCEVGPPSTGRPSTLPPDAGNHSRARKALREGRALPRHHPRDPTGVPRASVEATGDASTSRYCLGRRACCWNVDRGPHF